MMTKTEGAIRSNTMRELNTTVLQLQQQQQLHQLQRAYQTPIVHSRQIQLIQL